MKRLIACVSLVAVATTAAVPSTAPTKSPPQAAKAAKPVTKVAKCKMAPADEYFGKLKMSILGIRNTIKDQGLKVDFEPAKASSTFNSIALTEDAIRDWQHKYPCDSWLPGTLYALQHFYTKIHTQDGVKHVHATFKWLRHDFPKSKVVAAALKEDGAATAVPPSAPSGNTGDAGAPAVAVPSAAPTAPPNPFQQGTPFPGTAPAGVTNAQNAMASPSPRPHH